MADVIRLQAPAILAEAKKFRTEGVEFEEAIRRMDNLTQKLTEVWEGEAARAYVAKYEALKPNLEDCRNLIEDIAQALEKVVEMMGEMDRNIANAFN